MMDSVARKSYVYPAPVGEFHYLGASPCCKGAGQNCLAFRICLVLEGVSLGSIIKMTDIFRYLKQFKFAAV